MIAVYCERREKFVPFAAWCIQGNQANWCYRLGFSGECAHSFCFGCLIAVCFAMDTFLCVFLRHSLKGFSLQAKYWFSLFKMTILCNFSFLNYRFYLILFILYWRSANLSSSFFSGTCASSEFKRLSCWSKVWYCGQGIFFSLIFF